MLIASLFIYLNEFVCEVELMGLAAFNRMRMEVAEKEKASKKGKGEQPLDPEKEKAKKAKADKQQYSEYRRKLGFETGSKIYNEVLENVKKSLMIAYSSTQNIKDVQLRAKLLH